MTQAKSGDNVAIHYTGKLVDGTVFDTSEGREPLPCSLGSGQVIPGFEEAIIGMTQGESKTVTIPCEKAYGPHDQQKVIDFPVQQMPQDLTPEIGMQLQLQGPGGEQLIVRVTDISDNHITLDGNPPLAGQDLVFDIHLVSINAG